MLAAIISRYKWPINMFLAALVSFWSEIGQGPTVLIYCALPTYIRQSPFIYFGIGKYIFIL